MHMRGLQITTIMAAVFFLLVYFFILFLVFCKINFSFFFSKPKILLKILPNNFLLLTPHTTLF